MQDVAQPRLGFIGTGSITSAIVAGLRADPQLRCPIVLSPRNADVAFRLATAFADVAVAQSNQDVLDRSDVVFIAVRPPVAETVLNELRFRPDQRVISLVATFSRERIAALVRSAEAVTCAVPLPTVGDRSGPTAIFPPDAIAAALFERLGKAIEVATESEFQALWAATGVMATYFRFLDTVATWLAVHDVPAPRAYDYVAMMFGGLGAHARTSKNASFARLAEEFTTRGGLNEQCAAQLEQAGVFDACSRALDGILARIAGDAPRPSSAAASTDRD